MNVLLNVLVYHKMKSLGHDLKNACLKGKGENKVTLHHLARKSQSYIMSFLFSLLSPCP